MSLQKPQIVLTKVGDFSSGEVWVHFGDHFGVFECYREVGLSDGFPIHAAELIDLIDEVGDDFMVVGKFGLGALDVDFDWKWVTIGGIEFAIGVITGVVEE